MCCTRHAFNGTGSNLVLNWLVFDAKRLERLELCNLLRGMLKSMQGHVHIEAAREQNRKAAESEAERRIPWLGWARFAVADVLVQYSQRMSLQEKSLDVASLLEQIEVYRRELAGRILCCAVRDPFRTPFEDPRKAPLKASLRPLLC